MNRISRLESSNFALYFGDRMRNELSDIQLAMLAYHIDNRDDAEAGRLLREIFMPHVDVVLALLEERCPDLPDGEGPVCSTGYAAEDEESAMLDHRDRARECNR